MPETESKSSNDELFDEIVSSHPRLRSLAGHFQTIANYRVEGQTTVPDDRYDKAVDFFRKNGLEDFINRIQKSGQGAVE